MRGLPVCRGGGRVLHVCAVICETYARDVRVRPAIGRRVGARVDRSRVIAGQSAVRARRSGSAQEWATPAYYKLVAVIAFR
jgi:hypothetical protein